MTLREKVASGIAWSVIDKWGNQTLSLLVFILLARLLGPEAFGLVAMASVFTAFVSIFLDQGMREAVVQRPDLDGDHLSTAFWTNILIGTLMTGCGVVFSGVIAAIFKEPKLQPVVAVLSVSFLLAAVSGVQQALLLRKMDFKRLAAISMGSRVIGGTIGVGSALAGFDVWSLVYQQISAGVSSAILLWILSDWRPKFIVSSTRYRFERLAAGVMHDIERDF